jgi:hypothetical protein
LGPDLSSFIVACQAVAPPAGQQEETEDLIGVRPLVSQMISYEHYHLVLTLTNASLSGFVKGSNPWLHIKELRSRVQ